MNQNKSYVTDCIDMVYETASLGYQFLTKGTTASSKPPPSIQMMCDVLHETVELIHSASVENSLDAILSHIVSSGLLQLLSHFTHHPLLYTPDGTAGASLQQSFVNVRLAAAGCLESLFAHSGASSSGVAQWFTDQVSGLHIIVHMMNQVTSANTYEAVRLGLSRAVFSFVCDSPHAQGIASRDYLQQLMNALLLEPSSQVKNVIASILREIAVSHANCFADPKHVSSLQKMFQLDPSEDVRSLCGEILNLVIVCAVDCASIVPSLTQAVADRVSADESVQVQTVAARLAATLSSLAYERHMWNYFEVAIDRNLHRALAGNLQHRTSASACVAQAFRFLIQYCPYRLRIGASLLSHFPSLSTLLKCCMDLSAPGGLDVAQKVLCIELGIALSIIMAQSANYRQHLQRELHAVPLWGSTLKTSLVSFLNAASLDYFDGIDLVDVTGLRLNAVANVEWGDNDRPHRASIRNIFISQERRMREHRLDEPQIEASLLEPELRRKMRLTFVILTFAVHLTFQSPDAGNEEDKGGATPAATMRMSAAHGTPTGYSSFGATAVPHPESTSMPTAVKQPKFPNPHSPQQSHRRQSMTVTQKERQEMAFAYDRFDSAFQLTLQFAQYYSKHKQSKPNYEPTNDGFVVRSKKLKNPWGPIVTRETHKSWTVKDLKEGDLFYFAVPFDQLRATSMNAIVEKARRHLVHVKKELVTTPHAAKGRRWFLYDEVNNVMPAIVDTLLELTRLVSDHGGDNVRFPLFLFREKEMHLGERAIHSGNLVEVVDQVHYYFSQNPSEVLGVSASFVQHIEDRMKKLRQRTAANGGLSPVASDDDDENPGHGGISSDSD